MCTRISIVVEQIECIAFAFILSFELYATATNNVDRMASMENLFMSLIIPCKFLRIIYLRICFGLSVHFNYWNILSIIQLDVGQETWKIGIKFNYNKKENITEFYILSIDDIPVHYLHDAGWIFGVTNKCRESRLYRWLAIFSSISSACEISIPYCILFTSAVTCLEVTDYSSICETYEILNHSNLYSVYDTIYESFIYRSENYKSFRFINN